MKRILVIIALCSPLLMQAQSIEHILKSIEQNNKELKAQKHAADATKMENRTNNNLPDPTVSYSSFYSNGAEGGHGTEFVASQGFDFPTQYIARNRQATLQNEAVDKQQQAARRDILLNAKNLCLDLILLNQEKTLMDIRMKNADELQALYEKRLTAGDANILEVNKIKMERMNVQTEVAQNSAAHRTALQSLFNEMQQLKDAMNAYDVPLMYRSLDLLKQALTEGQISLIEYFVETESIYKNLQAYMQIENQYQKVMANIYKNNL